MNWQVERISVTYTGTTLIIPLNQKDMLISILRHTIQQSIQTKQTASKKPFALISPTGSTQALAHKLESLQLQATLAD